jgi:uncharacterized protein GlcG (DUF336 family)
MPRLTLAQANKIVDVALAKAREMKTKPLTVAVLDDAGHVKALQREDGANMFRNDIAIGKAFAALGMGASSRTCCSAPRTIRSSTARSPSSARASSCRRPARC